MQTREDFWDERTADFMVWLSIFWGVVMILYALGYLVWLWSL